MKTVLLLFLVFILSVSGTIMPARAASFYIQEQSVSGLGTAFAGAVADTPDASTIYYNPAGMTDLGRAQISVGSHILRPSAGFKDSGSTVSSTVGTGGASVPMTGSNGGDPFDPAAVPNAYLAFPASADKKIWVGIGISAPFGLKNEYRDDFFGRYDSTENELITVDIAPSVAVKIRDWLSLGLGVDIQSAQAKLESALPSPITAGGPVPATDGLQDLSGDALTVGFNAGVIIIPAAGTRVGLHYRQGVSHTLEGRVLTRVPDDVPGVGGTFSKSPIKAELDLPDIASAGFSQKITENLTLTGSITWFEWSNFDDILVELSNGTTARTPQNYKDTYAFALGARYDVNNRLTLKLGVQYDQTPTRDGFRSTRIPDGDRRWLAGGMTYHVNDAVSVDISGAYIDVSDEKIDLTGTVPVGAASTTSHIVAEGKGDVGIISAGLRYRFDIDPPQRRRNPLQD
jgi:long-chain fatty acid transport protein